MLERPRPFSAQGRALDTDVQHSFIVSNVDGDNADVADRYEDSSVYVDANTVSGATSSEFELSDSPAPETPAEDTPLVELFVKTVSGDVRLERAPAAAELTEQQ